MILFDNWYFLNGIVSICASFHLIYIQWTQFEHAAWHLHHFLILRDLLTCIVSLKQGVTLALSFGSFHDLQCSLHFQVGLCGRRVVHPLHSTVDSLANMLYLEVSKVWRQIWMGSPKLDIFVHHHGPSVQQARVSANHPIHCKASVIDCLSIWVIAVTL